MNTNNYKSIIYLSILKRIEIHQQMVNSSQIVKIDVNNA
mgnify:CR=1 FL=1